MGNLESSVTNITIYFFVAAAFIMLMFLIFKIKSIMRFLDFLLTDFPSLLILAMCYALPILVIFAIIDMIF